MVKIRVTLIGICWLLIGTAHAADHKEEMLRQTTMALSSGLCSVVLQKQYQIIAGGRTDGSYIANNEKLHQCQYVQEIMMNSFCVTAKKCPTYAAWSESHPEFSPSMPRSAFIEALEKRQGMVSAMRAAGGSIHFE